MTGLPLPNVPEKAVGMPASPVSTAKPSCFNTSMRAAEDWNSLKPSSGVDQTLSLTWVKRAALSSTNLQMSSRTDMILIAS